MVHPNIKALHFFVSHPQSVTWVFDAKLLFLEHSSENSGMGRMWRDYEKLSWPPETS